MPDWNRLRNGMLAAAAALTIAGAALAAPLGPVEQSEDEPDPPSLSQSKDSAGAKSKGNGWGKGNKWGKGKSDSDDLAPQRGEGSKGGRGKSNADDDDESAPGGGGGGKAKCPRGQVSVGRGRYAACMNAI